MEKKNMEKSITGYTFIKSILFDTDFYSKIYECTLTIELYKTELPQSPKIILIFYGVSNLKIGSIGGGLCQFLHITIENIMVRQWDRLYYEVKEMEDDKMSFYCRNYEIKQND
jgi:hypothetical protein